jgi:hypothetical protein
VRRLSLLICVKSTLISVSIGEGYNNHERLASGLNRAVWVINDLVWNFPFTSMNVRVLTFWRFSCCFVWPHFQGHLITLWMISTVFDSCPLGLFFRNKRIQAVETHFLTYLSTYENMTSISVSRSRHPDCETSIFKCFRIRPFRNVFYFVNIFMNGWDMLMNGNLTLLPDQRSKSW